MVVRALAPDHSGWTTREQPTLYWYISSLTTRPIEFTLTEMDAAQPLLTVRIKPRASAGIQPLQLADYGARLRVGVAYEWFVTVLADPQHGDSTNVIAGGVIERVNRPEGLSTTSSRADKSEAAVRLAEAGIWYDALQVLCELSEAEPANAYVRQQRDALLAQVGLGGYH